MAKTFRLKRTARKYQKAHGGRIVGTTGAYQVKKNTSKRKSTAWMRRLRRIQKKAAPKVRAFKPGRRTRSRGTETHHPGHFQENPVRHVKRPKGWIKAKAVKFERGKVLIKR